MGSIEEERRAGGCDARIPTATSAAAVAEMISVSHPVRSVSSRGRPGEPDPVTLEQALSAPQTGKRESTPVKPNYCNLDHGRKNSGVSAQIRSPLRPLASTDAHNTRNGARALRLSRWWTMHPLNVYLCRTFFGIAALFAIGGGPLVADTPVAPAFEVATIKLAKPDTAGPLIGISAGRLTLTGFTLKELMVYAYWIHQSQIVGASGWMDSEKFVIVAKPEGGQVPEPQLRQMLQTLLIDRFQLKLHHDLRQIPAYVLTLGKNGSKMKVRTPGDGGPGFRLVFQGARLPGRNASIAQLAFVLQAVVMDRPVIDKTGLMGNFDFDLSWSPTEAQFGGRGAITPAEPDSPDIFTAVQEQLGLKLESQKDPVDVLIIDNAEKPSEN